MGEERKLCKVWVGKLEGKISLRKPRRKRGGGIRMGLREIGWGV
jgi:hypothetical protein